MPIVVSVLGVVIVAMAVALFTISPTKDTADQVSVTGVEVRSEELAVTSNDTTSPNETTNDDDVVTMAPTTLTGTAKYSTPARITHDIAVTLTLDGDVVTDVFVNFDNGKGPANDHQKRFESSYKTAAIGQKLGNLSLSRVGGASLTSGGFNEAVAQIRAQI
jgi:hypothetical protein